MISTVSNVSHPSIYFPLSLSLFFSLSSPLSLSLSLSSVSHPLSPFSPPIHAMWCSALCCARLATSRRPIRYFCFHRSDCNHFSDFQLHFGWMMINLTTLFLHYGDELSWPELGSAGFSGRNAILSNMSSLDWLWFRVVSHRMVWYDRLNRKRQSMTERQYLFIASVKQGRIG